MWITGLDHAITTEVRLTRRSPGYGHPAVPERARGTGPCRACLRPFQIGVEDRLLFTYRPPQDGGTITAPGPVFIHAEDCPRYAAPRFPESLRGLPLLLEARGAGGTILATQHVTGSAIDAGISTLLALPGVSHLCLRHAEAGCWIARIDPHPPT